MIVNVLHLFNHYLPQTENWAYHLISNIPETRTLVAGKRYLKENFYNSNFTYYGHSYGELDKQYSYWGRNGLSGKFKQALYQGSKILLGDMRRGLLNFVQQEKVDLLHAHFADMGWYYHKIAQQANLPLVVSFYGWDYEMLASVKPIFQKRIQYLFQTATAFVCEGPHGAATLVKKGCPEEKVKVVPLGVLTDKIPFHDRKKKAGQLKLLQIASFTEKKGYHITIKALAEALPFCPGLTLTLVGGENQLGYRESIEREVIEKGLQGTVRILDPIDFSSLHHFMRDYDVFIHPSCHAQNGDCEGGAPIVLLDAQATGMPVISTEHCDIPSEVLHNQTGFLCQENDHLSLARHIRHFYAMTLEEFQNMSNSAQQHVYSQYEIKQNAFKLGALYQKIINA